MLLKQLCKWIISFTTVSVPPGLDGAGSTEDVTVVGGNMVSLLCVADGTPTPTVSWLKEGETLFPAPNLRFLNLNMSVQIPQAHVNNTGRYTCVVNNTAGQASRHFNLKVLGEENHTLAFLFIAEKWRVYFLIFCISTDPPRINGSDVVTEVSVIVNNALELQCEASGIPRPSLTWLKDGRPLTDGLRVLQGGEVLRVASAQVSAQSDGMKSYFISSYMLKPHIYAILHSVGGHR